MGLHQSCYSVNIETTNFD
ncbi:hypothetical protein C5167_045140 [Papaver somniferum]|uniref:Uncharacterized protein n=1 Tax=Papaver somniferum TaxID=3469 RepID=A0A4Y7LA54_PAPSO|nr:hypothetical protein C5167_045140 [Papaver somniferum]